MSKKIDPKRRSLRALPSLLKEVPPKDVPTRIELNDEEKKVIQGLNRSAQQLQSSLGDLRFQIMELESNELEVASKLQDTRTSIVETSQNIMKSRGVPVGTLEAGSWKMDFDTMILIRSDLPEAEVPVPPSTEKVD
jgi:hypothetical protein